MYNNYLFNSKMDTITKFIDWANKPIYHDYRTSIFTHTLGQKRLKQRYDEGDMIVNKTTPLESSEVKEKKILIFSALLVYFAL